MENNSNQGSIFNIGDLAKPVDTLIQRTSDFIGAALAPRQLVRMANAKVESDRIEKLGNVETEIRERALQRLLTEEIRNQENIENIVRLALPEVKKDAEPEKIPDDWLTNFFDKSKKFSGAEMQNIWSKILAGEANKEGSFSKRTLEIVSALDKSDAELFTDLCCYNWHIEFLQPVVFDYHDTIYKHKLNFDSLSHLEAIGLIKFANYSDSPEDGVFGTDEVSEKSDFLYFDNLFKVDVGERDGGLARIGNVLLTKSGKELASIIKVEKVDGFLEYVLEKWIGFGYRIASPLTEKY